jgi:hypothetical protein
MKGIFLAFLICISYRALFAEILHFTLDSIELGTKNEPILDLDKKPMQVYMDIAGLGTDKVTAEGTALPMVWFSKESRVFPMNGSQKLNISKDYGEEWYYTLFDQGVIIIELRHGRKSIRVHRLGAISVIYVGVQK